MNVESFKANVRLYRKTEVGRGVIFFALLGATALPPVFIIRRLDRVGIDTLSVFVVSVSFSVIAILMFCVLSPMMRKKQLRKLAAACSACGSLLLGKHSASVISTGRCPVCGIQILD